MTVRRTLAVVVLPILLLAVGACSPTSGSGSASSTTTGPQRKVTVAGDSISIGLGASLRAAMASDTAAVVKVIGEEGTGLARPDRFDWPARLVTLAQDFPPQVLVLSLSSNDAQDLTDQSGAVVARLADSAAWDAEYTRRLGASFDAFASSSTRVLWVGHVRTAEARVGDTNRRIHALAITAASGRSWVSVADLADLLHTGDSPATRCLMSDGLHVTATCLDEAAAGLVTRDPFR